MSLSIVVVVVLWSRQVQAGCGVVPSRRSMISLLPPRVYAKPLPMRDEPGEGTGFQRQISLLLLRLLRGDYRPSERFPSPARSGQQASLHDVGSEVVKRLAFPVP